MLYTEVEISHSLDISKRLGYVLKFNSDFCFHIILYRKGFSVTPSKLPFSNNQLNQSNCTEHYYYQY